VGTTEPSASLLQMLGAGGFGAILGWYLYFINRYRSADVRLADLVTLVGVLGGGGIAALFEPHSDMFAAYGVGLFLGFFGYFAVLLILVARSEDFTTDWFLDGRRKRPAGSTYVPDGVVTPQLAPMQANGSHTVAVNT
jgi:hypothetical protein